MAWGKAGSTDWSSGSARQIDSPTFTSNKFLQIMTYTNSGSTNRASFQFGDPTVDTGNNYAERKSENGGGDSTGASVDHIIIHTGNSDNFTVTYMINIATEEKLSITHSSNGVAGAGNAPGRIETYAKYAETSNQQTVVRVYDTTLDFTGGNVSVLGSDLTPAAAIPPTVSDGAIFHETDTNKSYVLYNGSWTEV